MWPDRSDSRRPRNRRRAAIRRNYPEANGYQVGFSQDNSAAARSRSSPMTRTCKVSCKKQSSCARPAEDSLARSLRGGKAKANNPFGHRPSLGAARSAQRTAVATPGASGVRPRAVGDSHCERRRAASGLAGPNPSRWRSPSPGGALCSFGEGGRIPGGLAMHSGMSRQPTRLPGSEPPGFGSVQRISKSPRWHSSMTRRCCRQVGATSNRSPGFGLKIGFTRRRREQENTELSAPADRLRPEIIPMIWGRPWAAPAADACSARLADRASWRCDSGAVDLSMSFYGRNG